MEPLALTPNIFANVIPFSVFELRVALVLTLVVPVLLYLCIRIGGSGQR